MHRNLERAVEQLLVGVADDAGLERAERRVAFGFAAHASRTWPRRRQRN